ncbi:MAG: WYL domain-containing protein [Planctomycetota bacterium]|jgi:proteasome accessory factor B|nr:WYL domain-containing protein [Planctomycetota bacterium]
MPEITKTERILNLVSLLLAARCPVPWRDIRVQVAGYQEDDDSTDPESLRRRFERDKRELVQLGIVLEYVQDDLAEGYRIVRSRSWMAPLDLDAKERALLGAVARSVRSDRDSPFVRHIQSALLKIGFDFPVDSDVWDPVPFSSATSEIHDEEMARNLATLGQAINRRKHVSFLYQSISATEPSQRKVAPHGLFYRDAFWYLVGHDPNHEEIRTYRIDRIQNRPHWRGDAERADFEISPEFTIDRYAKRPPWSFQGETDIQEVTARVRFDATHFWRVCESGMAREVHPDSQTAGEGIAIYHVTNPAAFLRYILAFGTHARILDPPSLILELKELLRKSLERLSTAEQEASGT